MKEKHRETFDTKLSSLHKQIINDNLMPQSCLFSSQSPESEKIITLSIRPISRVSILRESDNTSPLDTTDEKDHEDSIMMFEQRRD